MSKATCSIEGCERGVLARGWCQKHYSAWYSKGDPLAPPLPPRGKTPRKITVCTVEGCGKSHSSHGYCKMHYCRWRRHGDPLIVLKEHRRNPDALCSAEGCEEVSDTRGMCERHYRNWMYSQRGECSVEGCSTTWSAKGLCHKHYLRLRNWGTTDDPPESPLRGSCRVEGCAGPVKARDLCGMHLRRWYKWGTTDLPERTKYRTCSRCSRKLLREAFGGTSNVCLECYPHHRQEQNSIRLSRAAGVRQIASELRNKQRGRCAICGIPEEDAPRKRLHLDHNHKTMLVRGLLCGNCNNGIGHFKEDPLVLAAAIRYLEAAGLFAA